jgi:hypothetical protein
MTDHLVEIEDFLPQLAPALERRNLGESLGRMASQLNDFKSVAERLSDVLEISKLISFGNDPLQAATLRELIETAEDAATAMMKADTAPDLKEAEHDYNDFKRTLVATHTAVRQHWRSVVTAEYRPFTTVGRLLEKIEGTRDLGDRMVRLGNEADGSNNLASAGQLKTTILHLSHVRAALEAEKTIMTKDEEVDAFLSQLAQGRATLRLVTPNVFSWLGTHGALDLFDIRATV